MSANSESPSEQMATNPPTGSGEHHATGSGQPGGVDAAAAAGVGEVAWATDADPSAAGQPVGGVPAGGPPGTPTERGEGHTGSPSGDAASAPTISAEDLVQDLERVTAERDNYLDASRRLQAEFENYRKAVVKRETEARERANESLIAELLPVLDACDGALATGATDVEPVRASLVDTLTKQGLTRIDDEEAPFDPERHEAVIHEPDDDGNGPIVAEVMRAGYLWKGRVVRPAMVRVRG